MPSRCGCGDACSCLIVAGDNVTVEGIGTLERPYEIGTTVTNLLGRLIFTDDGTVDFTSTGIGTTVDPMVVSGDVDMALTDLSDVSPTPPAVGEVPVWRGDHWEFEAPPGGGSSSLPPGGEDGEVLTRQEVLVGTNIVPNPRFMGSPLTTLPPYYAWHVSKCTIAADPAMKRHPTGPQSAKVTVTDATGTVYIIAGANGVSGLPITAGQVLTAIASVFPDTGATGNFRLIVSYYSAAGTWVTDVQGASTPCPATAWTDLRLSLPAAPAESAFARLWISTGTTTRPVNSVFWVGEPMLVDRAYSDTYFDGATADTAVDTYAWVGTADQTPSTRNTLTADWEPATSLIPSGEWGTAPLTTATYGSSNLGGREIYVDSAGKIRSKPEQITGAIAQHPVTALATVYPSGNSLMYVSTSDGAAWPAGEGCLVVTQKASNSAAAQWCFRNSSGSNSGMWVRYGNTSAWSPWFPVGRALASGAWNTDPLHLYGTDSSVGDVTYLDSAGQMRTTPRELAGDKFSSSVLHTSYPQGVSLLGFSGTYGAANGWIGSSTVLTVRRTVGGGSSAFQIHSVYGSTNMRFRQSIAANAWGAWVQLAGEGVNNRILTGKAVVPVSNAFSGSVGVTFPAGFFTASPVLSLTVIGSSIWSPYSVTGVTASGFTCGVRHVDASVVTGSANVDWTAIETLA